jgi:hypothetical protein
MMTMIGSATAAPGVSIAMSAAIQSPLCIIIVSFFMMGMATCHAKLKHQRKEWLMPVLWSFSSQRSTDRTQLKLKYSHHQQPQQHRHYD